MKLPKSPGLPVLWLVLSIAALPASLMYVRWHAIDLQQEVDYHRNVRLLRTLDARFNVELLRLRSGLTANYDTLGDILNETKRSLTTIEAIPKFVESAVTGGFRSNIDELEDLFAQKRELAESFKTHNAVLRNSQHFVPIAVERLRSQPNVDTQVRHLADVVVSRVMLLNVEASSEALDKLLQAAAALGTVSGGSSAVGESALVVKHARMIAERKPLVDDLVQRILESRFSMAAGRLETLYSHQYRTALEQKRGQERALLAVWVVGITLALGGIIMRLRSDARVMARTRDELQRANQALAEEREKERSIGEMRVQFVSMISHEFRTPLSTILLSADMLQRYGGRWKFERQIVHLSRIRSAASDMEHLLEEILLIGRAETGILAATFAPVNLDELCREIVDTVQQTSDASHVLELALSGDPNVISDERLARHMLVNLLGNAIKYSPAGSNVRLRVEVADDSVRLSVSDQGIGIPAKDLPDLFTGFRRGSNVGSIGGTGLGLAVVKRVVNAFAGTICVSSVEGTGTEFRVELPHGRQSQEGLGTT